MLVITSPKYTGFELIQPLLNPLFDPILFPDPDHLLVKPLTKKESIRFFINRKPAINRFEFF